MSVRVTGRGMRYVKDEAVRAERERRVEVERRRVEAEEAMLKQRQKVARG
jgi:hypothetical protein